MAIFGKIFGGDEKSSKANEQNQSGLQLGRFTDCNKSEEQLASWDKSTAAFKDKKYIESWGHFFDYLGDSSLKNVTYKAENGQISFELIQGSKIVRGIASLDGVKAQVDLVKLDKPSVPVLRKMLAINYNFRYSSVAIKDNVLCMKFSSNAVDTNPTKLYFALKEIATSADKQDDLLAQEFSSVHMTDNQHIQELPDALKEIKYNYFCKWIDDTLAKIASLDEDKMSGAISFLMLSLALKIDYLLVPEGKVVEALERMQQTYFGSEASTFERNNLLRPEFEKLRNMPKDLVKGSFYKSRATFGIARAVDYKQVADFVLDESEKTGWYYDEKMYDIVAVIYEYIAGYSLFNWGMYKPLQDLFALYMQLVNQPFYLECGYTQELVNKSSGLPEKDKIVRAINEIVNRSKKDYPKFAFATENLKFNSVADFSASFFKEFDYFDFTK